MNTFEEYAVHLPFLYKHREEIYSNPEYFYTLLPFTIYNQTKAVCIGALLKTYEKGAPYHTISEDSKKEEFLAAYAGNPLSGTTTGMKTVLSADGTVEIERFSYCGFLALVHRLVVSFEECNIPYRESSLTIHDVIMQLKVYASDDGFVRYEPYNLGVALRHPLRLVTKNAKFCGNAIEAKRILLSTYPLINEQVVIVKKHNCIYITILAALIENNVEIIEKAMYKLGFSGCNFIEEKFHIDKKGRKWIDLRFETAKQSHVCYNMDFYMQKKFPNIHEVVILKIRPYMKEALSEDAKYNGFVGLALNCDDTSNFPEIIEIAKNLFGWSTHHIDLEKKVKKGYIPYRFYYINGEFLCTTKTGEKINLDEFLSQKPQLAFFSIIAEPLYGQNEVTTK